MKTLLQILPRLPGTRGGVGDYALSLAQLLWADFGVRTIFAIPKVEATEVEGFAVRRIDPGQGGSLTSQDVDWILLHYVNYGYQPRGLPLWLPGLLEAARGPEQRPLFTIFHELYATAPPWRSAFWLQPAQKRLARTIARLSKHCLVSSGTVEKQLRALHPAARISIQPVPSNFGEPSLSAAQIAERDPHRWVICGGTALVPRNLRSFARHWKFLPASIRPNELYVVGGAETDETRAALAEWTEVKVSYHPLVAVEAASALLATCAFGWLDYLDRRSVPLEVTLKSSSFAAYAAHGVVPIFPWDGERVCLGNDCLPGPYFANGQAQRLPTPEERAAAAAETYRFYQNHASTVKIAQRIAALLT